MGTRVKVRFWPWKNLQQTELLKLSLLVKSVTKVPYFSSREREREREREKNKVVSFSTLFLMFTLMWITAKELERVIESRDEFQWKKNKKCSGGEKMRNASGQQGEIERKWKKKTWNQETKSLVSTYDNSTIKTRGTFQQVPTRRIRLSFFC